MMSGPRLEGGGIGQRSLTGAEMGERSRSRTSRATRTTTRRSPTTRSEAEPESEEEEEEEVKQSRNNCYVTGKAAWTK